MKSNELRIGNFTKQGEVKSFVENGIHVGFGKCYNFNELEPMPLTEEWLFKFGFEYNNSTYEWYDKSAVFFIQMNYLGFDLIAKFKNERIKEIKYVHQLQNLYFALTNEELELKK